MLTMAVCEAPASRAQQTFLFHPLLDLQSKPTQHKLQETARKGAIIFVRRERENMSVCTKETYDIFVKQLLFFAQIIAASTALTKLQGERRQ